jgi:Fe-S oxidoreductase
MINHSDTSNAVYDITDQQYWDKESLNKELDRVFDVCIGCRLCFNLCPSFPTLFDTVDKIGDSKRQLAVAEGRVAEKDTDREYLELAEGEHAVEASIEVEFRGEVTDLSEAQKWEVIDLCYQCKLCDPVCPYTPGKDHEFQLDFPKLMTRSQAIRTQEHKVKASDRFLSNTDFSGKVGSLAAPLTNFVNTNKFFRMLMHHVVGIHKDRILPKFHGETLEKWFKRHYEKVDLDLDPSNNASDEKVVIFGTCFVNNNDPEVGKAAISILKHNDVIVAYPKQQCCGAPFLSPGDFKGFRKQAEPNIMELVKWIDKGYKVVVTGPPTCSLTLKKEYPYIFGKDRELAAPAQKVSESTFDISEYLMYLHKKERLRTDFKHEIGAVNYHVSCHLKAQSMGFKSRDLLRLVPNTKIRMINRCSGMDGGWGMKKEFFHDSLEVGKKCVKDLDKKDADITCSDCTLAALQIYQASDERIKAEHPIETLQRAYGLSSRAG